MLILASIILAVIVTAWSVCRACTCERALPPRSLPVTRPIEIICGDCAGEERRPDRTVLALRDRYGACCHQCGGRSFVLASNVRLAPHATRVHAFNCDPYQIRPEENPNERVTYV